MEDVALRRIGEMVNVMLKYHGFCCVYAGWDEMRSVFRMMDPDQGSYPPKGGFTRGEGVRSPVYRSLGCPPLSLFI